MDNKATGVWKSFFLSFILPIIGGLIVYSRNKRKNIELAKICLSLSLLHPFIPLLFSIFFSDSLIGMGIALALTIGLVRAYEKNAYKYFIPVWYFGIFGLIYSYYFGYEKDNSLREEVGRFFLSQILALIVLIGILLLFVLFSLDIL